MSYSNGLLPSETKTGGGQRGLRSLPGVGFKLTDNGNFDIDGKRLTDLGEPTEDGDATTKKYVNENKPNKNIVILRDGSQNMTGNLDLNDKNIVNVADYTDDGDAVNKKQLKAYTQFSQNNYHLQPSFRFYKDFGDKSQLTIGTPPNTPSNHFFQSHKAHNDAYIIEKEDDDTGFSGEAWSNMKMKGNNLSSGSYTAIFEIFVIGPSGSFRVDDTIIYQVYGDSHYTIDTFNSNKINSQYTKSFIQFTTDGGAGVDDGIKFQIKYFGSQYNKNIRFLFYSRVIKGKQSTSFDHTIFNVQDVQDNHTILYFENLNLNGNLIDGLGNPERLAHATNKNYVDTENARQDIAIADKANKSYVDDEIAKIPNNYYKNNEDILVAKKKKVTFQIDPTNSFPATPSYVMNMNRYGIEKCGPITMADSGNSDIDMNNSEIKKIGGIEMNDDNDSEIDMKNNKITDVGGIVMYNDDDSQINMNGNKIINLDTPSGDNHAANKKYVDDKISEIPAGDTSGLLPLDGSKAMTGDLNINNNEIKNLKDPKPSDSNHAASVNFVNKTISDNNVVLDTLIDTKIEASEEASIRAV